MRSSRPWLIATASSLNSFEEKKSQNVIHHELFAHVMWLTLAAGRLFCLQRAYCGGKKSMLMPFPYSTKLLCVVNLSTKTLTIKIHEKLDTLSLLLPPKSCLRHFFSDCCLTMYLFCPYCSRLVFCSSGLTSVLCHFFFRVIL